MDALLVAVLWIAGILFLMIIVLILISVAGNKMGFEVNEMFKSIYYKSGKKNEDKDL